MMVTPDVMAMGGAAPATDWTVAVGGGEDPRLAAALAGGAAGDQRSAWTRCAPSASTSTTSPTRAWRSARCRSRPIRRSRTPIRKRAPAAAQGHLPGGDAARGRAQHGLAPQLPRLVGRDELLPGLLEPARGGGGESGGEEVRRHRPVDEDADRRALHRHRLQHGRCGKGTMRPRYVDCPGGATSVDEVTGNVREFQYSSVMDYGAEFNSDLHGLGRYDKAAMKFSYAGDGFVEVFPTPSSTATASSCGRRSSPSRTRTACRRRSTSATPDSGGHPVHHLSGAVRQRRRRPRPARRRALLGHHRRRSGRLRPVGHARRVRWCRTTSAPTSSSAT